MIQQPADDAARAEACGEGASGEGPSGAWGGVSPGAAAGGSAAAGVPIEVREHGRTRTVIYPGDRLWSIGRAPNCELPLEQPRASRHHAELFGEGGRFTLIDAGSANGTFVNGQRIQRCALVLGDEITIGTATLRFGVRPARGHARSAGVTAARTGPAGAGPAGPEGPRGPAEGDLAVGHLAVGDLAVGVQTAGRSAAGARGAPGAAGSADPGSERAALAGRAPGSATSRRGRRGGAWRITQGALACVLLGGLAYGVWWFVQHADDPGGLPRSLGTVLDHRPPAVSRSPETVHQAAQGTAFDAPGAQLGAHENPVSRGGFEPESPHLDDPVGAHQALEVMREELVRGTGGWALLERLEELRHMHPGTRAAEQARQWNLLLTGVRRGVELEARARAESALDTWIAAERPILALAGARLLETLAADETEQLYWRGRAADLEATARSRFRALERDLGDLLAAGDPGGALRALVDAQARFGGLDFYAEELPRYVEAALVGATLEAPPPPAAELLSLSDQAARAFDDCRFGDLAPIYHRMLALPLSIDDRLTALEGLVRSHALARLFEDFLAQAAGKSFEVSLSDQYRGKVVRVTEREVEQELDVGGHAYRETLTWLRLGPVKKYALFEAVALGQDALVGLAFYARAIGHEEGWQETLVRLFQRNAAGQALASALLAQERRQGLPEAGYVVHKQRLMTVAERDAAVELARMRKEEEQRAVAELKRLRRESSLSAALEWARELRRRTNFELAHHILLELTSRFAGTEGAREAQELLDDPVLAVVPMERTGPSANRLDIVFLGDGWPVENDYQQAFLIRAEVCKNLLLNEEPYREYRSYLNFVALQLGSRERGLDRVPGNVVRDTPLDGKVEWTVITVNPAKVHAILARVFGSEHDGQAVVIGNDYADVATGGGGVSTLSKASLIPVGHEIGHALGGLRDEYDSAPGNNPERLIPKGREAYVPTAPMPPNVMVGSDRADVLANALWRPWIEAGEARWWNRSRVDVFEGANRTPFQHWRPQMDCKMRNAGSHFCVVCMEVMVKQIYRHVRPIDAVEPPPIGDDAAPGDLELGPGTTLTFRVTPMKPAAHFLEARWFLEDLGFAPTPTPDPDLAGSPPPDRGQTGVLPRPTPGPDPSAPDAPRGKPHRRVYRSMSPEGRVLECAELRAVDLAPGHYLLTVEIRDPTEWVLEDPEGLLRETRSWRIYRPDR